MPRLFVLEHQRGHLVSYLLNADYLVVFVQIEVAERLLLYLTLREVRLAHVPGCIGARCPVAFHFFFAVGSVDKHVGYVTIDYKVAIGKQYVALKVVYHLVRCTHYDWLLHLLSDAGRAFLAQKVLVDLRVATRSTLLLGRRINIQKL